jgi:N,N'-diacetyllegionaminate synthase
MTARVEIIAEIANAHQGDPAAAERLARDVVAAGADAVKFQVYFAEELLARQHPRFQHFQELAFAPEVWQGLIAGLRASGARVYCDVFGARALAVASAAGADGFKIHSSDLGNDPLVRAAAALGKPLLLAVGGSTMQEISHAVALIEHAGGRPPVLLHGFQSYPTAVEDTRLERLRWLRAHFGSRCAFGYMDHVDAEDPFGMVLPLIAYGAGARVIEKHVTQERRSRGLDYYSSLEPQEFAAFVRLVRRAEQAMGEDPEPFSEAERTYRRQVKKQWVAARPLTAGTRLAETDLLMKRAGSEAGVAALSELLGRPLRHDLPADTVVTRADIAQEAWALVVARMQSCRLPGKALVDLAGMPALAHLLRRLQQARRLNRIVLCTTTAAEDDALAALGRELGVAVFRGPSEDVLARLVGAIEGQPVDVALRVTGDDLLVDPEYVDLAIEHHGRVNAQYTDLKALPSGTEVEVFDADLLRLLAATARDRRGTEYLTTYIARHRDQFETASAPVEPAHRRDWRLTLDTPEDLEVIRAFLSAMQAQDKALTYRLDDVVAYFSAHPEVLARNAQVRQRQTPPDVCTELAWERLAAGAPGGGTG